MNPKAISSNTTIEKQISHIVGTLLLNGTLTESPGLVHGKMGIAIFFSIMRNIQKTCCLQIMP